MSHADRGALGASFGIEGASYGKEGAVFGGKGGHSKGQKNITTVKNVLFPNLSR